MVTGRCLCGTVRWRMDGPYGSMTHCHCTMCRKAHGAPFATYISADKARYELLSGAEAIRDYESSKNFHRKFCARCGSALPMADNEHVYVPAGCLDDDPGMRPQRHIFAESKAPWHTIADALPRIEGYGPGEASVMPESAPGEAETLRGSCLCGGVAFEANGPLLAVHNCHCSRCRKARAAAHTTNGFVATESLRFLKGEDLLDRYKVPEAKFFTQAFCRVCGCGMPNKDPSRDRAAIPFGALDTDPGRGAADHIYCAFKAPWYEIADALPQHDERP